MNWAQNDKDFLLIGDGRGLGMGKTFQKECLVQTQSWKPVKTVKMQCEAALWKSYVISL